MKCLIVAAACGVALPCAASSLAASRPLSDAFPEPPSVVLPCEGYEELLFCGELNGDCDVTAVDALIGLRMAVGQLEAVQEADIDRTGDVTAGDALKILRIAVGSLPLTYGCDPNHVVLDATSSGFFSQTGAHTSGNYAVGWYATGMDELRDYFVFDLSAVDTPILSAKFRADTAPVGYTKYLSSDPSETYQLVQVETPIDTLTGGGGGVATFDDLATGALYGSVEISPGTVKQLTEVDLNAAGLAALGAEDAAVAFGGSLSTLSKGPSNEAVFNSTSADLRRQLILTVAPSQ